MSEGRTGPSLPHGYPFLLLDRILDVVPGVSALGIRPDSGAMLARIHRFRVSRRAIVAGDQLCVRARILRVFGRTVKARGDVRVNLRTRAAGELVLQLA
jgi:hypothetical protein